MKAPSSSSPTHSSQLVLNVTTRWHSDKSGSSVLSNVTPDRLPPKYDFPGLAIECSLPSQLYGASEAAGSKDHCGLHTSGERPRQAIATILTSICLRDSHDSLRIDNPTLSAVRQVSSDSITSMSFHAPTLLHLPLRKLLHQLQNCASARPQFTCPPMSDSIDFSASHPTPSCKLLFLFD